MENVIKVVVVFILGVYLLGCTPQSEGEIVKLYIESSAISKSLLKENANQEVVVYLPPGYRSSKKRFPVIFFLHGFAVTNRYVETRKYLLDKAVKEGAEPFIIVEPNGNSSLGSSFFANSPASGNWEDYIVDELVAYIDQNFRTKAEKKYRFLSGHSMGGTAAINIGLKYPDRFNAVYSFSPGILKDGEIEILLESWKFYGDVLRSYGAAASPIVDKEPYLEIPNKTYADSVENERVIKNWYSLYGNFSKKVENYSKKNHSLSGITISINENDGYDWIVSGGKDLSRILNNNNIEHELIVGNDGHGLPGQFYCNILIPYFSYQLN